MEIVILGNTIILDIIQIDPDEGDNMNNAKIAWDNALSRATLTGSVDDSNTGNLFDYMTTTFWGAGVGTSTVDIVLSSAENINCAAITAGNWADAGTVIEVYTDAGITKVGEISGLKNGQPYLFVFDSVLTSVLQIKFISVGDLSVGQVLFGSTLDFPVKASVGLQLGKFNNRDKVIGQMTENNAFGANSTVKRARDTISPFNLLPISWVNDTWVGFSGSHKGKPIWFSWNSSDNPLDVTFGHWSTDDVRYTSSFLSALNLTVKGHV